MTYMNQTDTKIKIMASLFWIAILLVSAYVSPMLIVPVALIAMFHGAYLMLNPLPLPIVLSFVCMVSLSTFAVYLNVGSKLL